MQVDDVFGTGSQRRLLCSQGVLDGYWPGGFVVGKESLLHEQATEGCCANASGSATEKVPTGHIRAIGAAVHGHLSLGQRLIEIQ